MRDMRRDHGGFFNAADIGRFSADISPVSQVYFAAYGIVCHGLLRRNASATVLFDVDPVKQFLKYRL
jgi:hypothetical protein